MLKKIKALFKRSKAVIAMAAFACISAMTAVVASAETVEASSNMEAMLTSAGSQLTDQFSSLVSTVIPVILGILGSGLVIYGIMALIRLAKKTFGKVAG